MTKKKFIMVLIIYLLGLFIGALDTGIVTPARPVIQNSLGVDPSSGIWMITIYTLFYAASIPVMGKLADVYGSKYVYLVSILLFGAGSLFCGLSGEFNSFIMLIVARAVQAIGGGGIMPVATAEFGVSFPPEKRGMALGMVGGVYGIANVFGASAGSAIMDIFGTDNWAYIFYINVPITIAIICIGIFNLENHKTVNTNKLDLLGIVVVVIMIFSLLYGLKSLDFFEFTTSIKDPEVYRYLIIFAILLPIFILIENKAQDPVMNLNYFKDRNIAIALVVSVLSGVVLMGIIFVPQFSENILRMETGTGGYLVIILGLFAGVGAPISGKFVDKYGAKIVLIGGFLGVALGSLFLIMVTPKYPGMLTVTIGLIIIGTGMGFTMGTPLNYIMLENTDDREANSALATMSLVRSIGTAVAPAIMVGFIAHAGMSVQDTIMDLLPQKISVSNLPHYEEIVKEVNELKKSDEMKDVDIPDFDGMTTVDFSDISDSDYEVPEETLELLQNSDVTTITANVKTMATVMFEEMTPDVIKEISEGIEAGRDGIKTGRNEILKAVSKMQEGYDGIGEGIEGIRTGMSQMKTAEKQIDSAIKSLKNPKPLKAINKQIKKMNASIDSMEESKKNMESYVDIMKAMPDEKLPEGKNLLDFVPDKVKGQLSDEVKNQLASVTSAAQLETMIGNMDKGISGQQQAVKKMKESAKVLEQLKNKGTVPKGKSLLDVMPANVKKKLPSDVKKKLSKAHSISDLRKMKSELVSARNKMAAQINEMEVEREEMSSAMDEMNDTAEDMAQLSENMKELEDALPEAFKQAHDQYLSEIHGRHEIIESAFQKTLNEGFKHIYLTTFFASIVGILLLLLYSRKREKASRL